MIGDEWPLIRVYLIYINKHISLWMAIRVELISLGSLLKRLWIFLIYQGPDRRELSKENRERFCCFQLAGQHGHPMVVTARTPMPVRPQGD